MTNLYHRDEVAEEASEDPVMQEEYDEGQREEEQAADDVAEA